MVFYLKYRPQTLEQLIGQSQVKLTLQKAMENNKLAHAYLFCGPRGTGKTSTARILAKMVNCTGTTTLPCNVCDNCKSITNGSNLDLIEIDAASNRGIDDIRDLREKIKLSPSGAKKKVYIIDEVHMLTSEAFNALLKTLEEPPEHALFILATTEAHKVPETILSRVQRLDFKMATSADLIEALGRVVKSEKLKIDDQALNLLAKKADGSFRDSLKLLDQLAAQSSEISLEMVEQSLNSGKFSDLVELLEAVAKKDASRALSLLHKQLEAGINLKDYLFELLNIFRVLMLVKHQAIVVAKEQYGSQNSELLLNLSQKFATEDLIKTLILFQTASEKLKFASIPSLPLEVAIVESCMGGIGSNENAITPLQHDKPVSDQPVPKSQPSKTIPSDDLLKILDKWNYVLETIKPYNYSLEALLRQVKVLSCTDGRVMLEVPYSFHQRILEAPKSRDLLESVLAEVLGKSVRVSCVLGQRPVRVEEVANIELAADDDVIKLAAEIFNS